MAFIRYSEPWKGKMCEVIPHDKALAINKALHSPEILAELSDEKIDYLKHVKAVHLGTPKPAEQVAEKLTNPGVLQGMSEIIPRGDR